MSISAGSYVKQTDPKIISRTNVLVLQCLLLVLIVMEATIATVNMDSRITKIPMEMEKYIVWITLDHEIIGVAIKPFQMRDV